MSERILKQARILKAPHPVLQEHGVRRGDVWREQDDPLDAHRRKRRQYDQQRLLEERGPGSEHGQDVALAAWARLSFAHAISLDTRSERSGIDLRGFARHGRSQGVSAPGSPSVSAPGDSLRMARW